MTSKVVTISRHIMEMERNFPGATGDFSGLMSDITLAAKMIQREVTKAGLVNILGKAGDVNVQGEEQEKLDVFADLTMFRAMDHGGHLCVMASEENEEVLHIPDPYPCGKYVLNYDPLDGSSNIDANVTIGTIFSVLRRITPGDGRGDATDCMQPGFKQVAAGYVMYGSSTMFVYTTGAGVHGFTLDPSVGEFLLSHENIRIPKRGQIYSTNEGNYHRWDEPTRRYVDWVKAEEKSDNRPYSSRYIGSMVCDIHRTLLYGGIYLYPADNRNPEGKLRLLYEANPLAFIVEQAGGAAIDGRQRILDKVPDGLHQRTPLIIGSTEDVGRYADFVAGKR
ncbi:MAG: class 1 fructose-bisphosphatase [Candidatus Eisenbacteria bacterium]|nr:class 1 fructose-bisphosphatase [Candidatus Eisenbacteria bacterium]